MRYTLESKFFILLLCAVLIGCDDQSPQTAIVSKASLLEINQDSLELRPNEGLYYFEGVPFSGRSISLYPDRSKASSVEYQKGKKHGTYRRWFENGIKSFESEYIDGKQAGKTISWWRNGNKRSESNFKAGILDGVQEEWYKSGAKFKKMNIVNGQEEGMQQSWRENGKLYNNYEAKNGRIFGLKRAALCYQLEDEEVQYSNE